MADIQRQIAYKVRAGDILRGEFHERPGWDPNYIVVRDLKVSRVNLLGVVIEVPVDSQAGFYSMVIDDGTGTLSLRSFETINIFRSFIAGDMVLVVGRPRIYGSEKYIQPETVRKITDKRLIVLRQREIDLHKLLLHGDLDEPTTVVEKPRSSEAILDIIRESDLGDGADVGDIVRKLNVPNAEALVTQLLEEGNVFETRPGKIKVLD